MSSASATSAPPPLVRRQDESGVVILTLAQPQNRNALGLAMIDTLIVAFADIAKDQAARVVVVAGDGPAFSAGHDLREIQAHRNDPDHGRTFYELIMTRCATFMQAIVALPKPVIAAVEGVATAAGCQLVASCDFAVAGDAGPLRPAGRQYRALLLVAAGRGRTDGVAQARHGNGLDRPALHRRRGRAHGARQSRRSRGSGVGGGPGAGGRASHCARPRRSRSASAPSTSRSSSRSPSLMRSRPRRWSTISPSPTAVEGIGAFLEKRQPRWGA